MYDLNGAYCEVAAWLSIGAFLAIEIPPKFALLKAASSLVAVFLSPIWLGIRLKVLTFLLDI